MKLWLPSATSAQTCRGWAAVPACTCSAAARWVGGTERAPNRKDCSLALSPASIAFCLTSLFSWMSCFDFSDLGFVFAPPLALNVFRRGSPHHFFFLFFRLSLSPILSLIPKNYIRTFHPICYFVVLNSTTNNFFRSWSQQYVQFTPIVGCVCVCNSSSVLRVHAVFIALSTVNCEYGLLFFAPADATCLPRVISACRSSGCSR